MARCYAPRRRDCNGHPSYNRDMVAGRLPGADLVDAGLLDLREGRETIASLLVSIGAPKLS